MRAASKSPSAASSARRRSMRASSSPIPTARIVSTRRLSVPRPRKNDGLPCTTTRLPSATAGAAVADQPDRGGELQRHVGGGVAQDEERGARARPRGDLRELALHPHGPEPVHPRGDLAGDGADGPRRVGESARYRSRRVPAARRPRSPLGDRCDPVAEHGHVRRPVAVRRAPRPAARAGRRRRGGAACRAAGGWSASRSRAGRAGRSASRRRGRRRRFGVDRAADRPGDRPRRPGRARDAARVDGRRPRAPLGASARRCAAAAGRRRTSPTPARPRSAARCPAPGRP